ncbi:capping protein (actin filament) muscle Z-line, alpha [Paragonimus westermani]|uniref:F-actin-capping protein subunit alpha n=1 Tax=Paragonimus westermani TaxID=34504 RepID=A0A5J4P1M8_9TREM|nr:capping protein (actin filament) muscle Z-line, alpha [Paragonimus westermani]
MSPTAKTDTYGHLISMESSVEVYTVRRSVYNSTDSNQRFCALVGELSHASMPAIVVMCDNAPFQVGFVGVLPKDVEFYLQRLEYSERKIETTVGYSLECIDCTGRWRSEWIVKFPDDLEHGCFSVHGILKVQRGMQRIDDSVMKIFFVSGLQSMGTHLYEEGNVQLISSKEIDFTLSAQDPKTFAKECVRQIKEADIAYQASILTKVAVGENFKTMSDTTFKALRRQLPLTRSKIDWNKIITYQIGSELSRAS